MSRPVTVAALLVGGLLWAVHGTLTMLQPWGEESRYSESRGYSVVLDQGAYLAYNTPGALALLLTSLAMLDVGRSSTPGRPRVFRLGRASSLAAAVLGAVSTVGVVILLDPVFTTARVLGSVLQGVGGCLLARATAPDGPRTRWLAVTGVLALGLLPLWPLVYAVRIVPEWGGALYFLGFAVAWWAGARLRPSGPT